MTLNKYVEPHYYSRLYLCLGKLAIDYKEKGMVKIDTLGVDFWQNRNLIDILKMFKSRSKPADEWGESCQHRVWHKSYRFNNVFGGTMRERDAVMH